jgi:hypothetical protein
VPSLIRDGYVIDTCALIDLWHRYPPVTFDSLWTKIDELVKEGRLRCPGQVLAELRRRDDEICEWLEKRNDRVVLREDVTVFNHAQHLVSKLKGLIDHSRTGPQADPFVIALAKSLGWTVVTSERTKGIGAVNIPSVCRAEAVPCLDLIRFFAREGWKL